MFVLQSCVLNDSLSTSLIILMRNEAVITSSTCHPSLIECSVKQKNIHLGDSISVVLIPDVLFMFI